MILLAAITDTDPPSPPEGVHFGALNLTNVLSITAMVLTVGLALARYIGKKIDSRKEIERLQHEHEIERQRILDERNAKIDAVVLGYTAPDGTQIKSINDRLADILHSNSREHAMVKEFMATVDKRVESVNRKVGKIGKEVNALKNSLADGDLG